MRPAARKRLLASAATGVLLLLCALFAFPFLWMFFATFKTNPEIFRPFPLLPSVFHGEHYRALLSGGLIPYPRQFLNSLLIAAAQTLLALAFACAAGFVFGKYAFRGKRMLFALAVMVVLIPRQVMALPLFVWMSNLHLLDGPWAVIWPGTVAGIGVLYFTQVFRRMPEELLDLARSEGASEYRVFVTLLPLARPALIAYGLIHFILAWHEHIIPLVMLNSSEKLTVSLALATLHGDNLRIPEAVMMVGSTLTLVPTVLLYLLVQRHFKSSLAELTS